ncbi:LysR family transcriptional regulator [Hydrogenophaga laconesensis]|uniref:LysR family nitrogen assimilation transcriptional regulator n=1 Tax=Hydrogenophaga laconesensis TaxID=1805971 RepID=A0ABU1VDQ6_9BURK|nr:LysR substrate-binding domain-containing protein [Hydrogenophaga laconesensis]MDR7095605.1 LysR family nitrogen assimilation transcriptional regulator [Hydrogenophaga laconesensis]
MELRQLKYFLCIADSGSLSRASEKLHIAQSALSRQIMELEADLEARLMVRGRSGVSLTPEGEVLYDYALGITKQVANLRAAVRSSSDVVTGAIVLALPQTITTVLALPLMRAAAATFPGIAFRLNEELSGNVMDQMHRGLIDLTILCDSGTEQNLRFTPLVDEEFVLLRAPHATDAPSTDDVSLVAACSRPMIMPSTENGHTTRWVIEAALQAAGLPSLNVVAEMNSIHLIKSAVEAGLGFSVMPLALAEREVNDGRLIAHRIDGGRMRRRLSICEPLNFSESKARQAICDMIRHTAREMCEKNRWPGAHCLSLESPMH